MRVIRSAQFELSVDGVPRSYRDRKDLALQSAQILKSRNPNSVVRLKDLQTGEEIVIAFKSGPAKFTNRREAKDWCTAHNPSSPIKEIGADASERRTRAMPRKGPLRRRG